MLYKRKGKRTRDFHILFSPGNGLSFFLKRKKNCDAIRQEVSHMFITCLSGIVLVSKGKLKKKDVERI